MCHCESGSANDKPVAGRYCEHVATSLCVEQGEIGDALSFCTNGGTCIENVLINEQHAGCYCKEGWTGRFCDEKIRKGGSSVSSAESSQFKKLLLWNVALLSFVVKALL